MSKVKELINTISDVVVEVAKTGTLLADNNTLKIRRQVCSQCEFQHSNRCQKCGCFINAKTSLAASRCPIKRW